MHPYCFFNGKIVKTNKPHIMLDDISILRGFGAFDFFRVYNGAPFMFFEHFERFTNSAKMLGMSIPYEESFLRGVINKLMKKNKTKFAHVRMVLTGGKTLNGLEPSTPNFFILFEEFNDLPEYMFLDGVKIITNKHERLLPKAKTTNYMQAVCLQEIKKEKDAVEILYLSNGKISEATTSNIFMVKNNNIYTTKDNILFGLTRKKVIDLAEKRGYKVFEQDISIEDLISSDEVFLTATNKKVLPVVLIDENKISNGKVGDVSKELLEDLNNFIKDSAE